MFGRAQVRSSDVLPHYVDYQERLVETGAIEWTDRVYADGRWSGNVYDFYRKVGLKLTADLKVPFRLRPRPLPARRDARPRGRPRSPVSTLIHADYEGRTAILVTMEPGGFTFRNPALRDSLEQIRQGGHLTAATAAQKMFLMLDRRAGGLGVLEDPPRLARGTAETPGNRAGRRPGHDHPDVEHDEPRAGRGCASASLRRRGRRPPGGCPMALAIAQEHTKRHARGLRENRWGIPATTLMLQSLPGRECWRSGLAGRAATAWPHVGLPRGPSTAGRACHARCNRTWIQGQIQARIQAPASRTPSPQCLRGRVPDRGADH